MIERSNRRPLIVRGRTANNLGAELDRSRSAALNAHTSTSPRGRSARHVRLARKRRPPWADLHTLARGYRWPAWPDLTPPRSKISPAGVASGGSAASRSRLATPRSTRCRGPGRMRSTPYRAAPEANEDARARRAQHTAWTPMINVPAAIRAPETVPPGPACCTARSAISCSPLWRRERAARRYTLTNHLPPDGRRRRSLGQAARQLAPAGALAPRGMDSAWGCRLPAGALGVFSRPVEGPLMRRSGQGRREASADSRAVCALKFTGSSHALMPSGGAAHMHADGRDERQRLIDREFAATVRTWEDQQRLRHRILSRAHDLAARLSRDGAPAALTSENRGRHQTGYVR